MENENVEHLSEEAIEDRLKEIKGKIPSFLIEDLKRNLNGKGVTESQIDRIVGRITDMYRMRQERLDSSVEAVKDIAIIKDELSALKRDMAVIKGGVENVLSDLRILVFPDIDIESIITETVAGVAGDTDAKSDDEPMADVVAGAADAAAAVLPLIEEAITEA
jgi:hypothetical protein